MRGIIKLVLFLGNFESMRRGEEEEKKEKEKKEKRDDRRGGVRGDHFQADEG